MMSMKTHYAIAQANETDQAFEVGSISPANSAGPSCKHFFPCDEGSGTTLTDVIGGANLATATNAWGTGPDGGGYHDGADSTEATAAAFYDFVNNDYMFFAVMDRGDSAVVGGMGMGDSGVNESGVALVAGGILGGARLEINDGEATSAAVTMDLAGPDVETQPLSGGLIKIGAVGYTWMFDGTTVSTDTMALAAVTTFQPKQVLTSSAWGYGMMLGLLPDSSLFTVAQYYEMFVKMDVDWRANRKVLPADLIVI